jgi:hypothetical protein
MMTRGLLGFAPDNIAGRDEVRAIFQACLAEDHGHARDQEGE